MTMFMINISREVNSVCPDQTAPTGAVWPQESLILIYSVDEASKQFQQMTKADDL